MISFKYEIGSYTWWYTEGDDRSFYCLFCGEEVVTKDTPPGQVPKNSLNHKICCPKEECRFLANLLGENNSGGTDIRPKAHRILNDY